MLSDHSHYNRQISFFSSIKNSSLREKNNVFVLGCTTVTYMRRPNYKCYLYRCRSEEECPLVCVSTLKALILCANTQIPSKDGTTGFMRLPELTTTTTTVPTTVTYPNVTRMSTTTISTVSVSFPSVEPDPNPEFPSVEPDKSPGQLAFEARQEATLSWLCSCEGMNRETF